MATAGSQSTPEEGRSKHRTDDDARTLSIRQQDVRCILGARAHAIKWNRLPAYCLATSSARFSVNQDVVDAHDAGPGPGLESRCSARCSAAARGPCSPTTTFSFANTQDTQALGDMRLPSILDGDTT
jgi:hypothetical protein